MREERNALRQQLVKMDADNAELAQRLRLLDGVQAECVRVRQEIADLREQVIPDYQIELAKARAEIDRLTRENVIATDALNSTLEQRTNGAGHAMDPTPADWGSSHPAWSALPSADFAAIDQLASGRTTFRRLSKTLRRDLVHRVIRHLAAANNGTLNSSQWDRLRPLWLPTQGAVIMLSTSGHWSSLVAEALNQPVTN